MIYVLVYNPAEIYGRWPDHDYLPMFVPPPPNFYSAGIGFSIGFGVTGGSGDGAIRTGASMRWSSIRSATAASRPRPTSLATTSPLRTIHGIGQRR